jgi:hypothetical protein
MLHPSASRTSPLPQCYETAWSDSAVGSRGFLRTAPTDFPCYSTTTVVGMLNAPIRQNVLQVILIIVGMLECSDSPERSTRDFLGKAR